MVTVSMAGKNKGEGGKEIVRLVDENSDVLFVDYDGTAVAGYSFEEVAKLSTLPNPPAHEGLKFQEWNWTLAEIKSVNQPVVVGALYVTNDGKSRVYIETPLDNKEVSLWVNQSVANGALVEWGDGSTETIAGTGNVNPKHTYVNKGEYVIKISTANGVVSIGNTSSWNNGYSIVDANFFVKFEQGNHSINYGCFRDCFLVKSISFSTNGITSDVITRRMFYGCKHLQCVVLTRALNTLSSETFDESYGLKYIALPITITTTDGMTNLYKLRRYNGHKATIKYGPKGNCSAPLILNEGLTRIGQTGGYYQLQGDVAVLPDSVTTIDSYAMTYVCGVKKLVFGKGITSIPTYVCQYGFFTEVEIGENVTSIGSGSFSSCTKLMRIRFNSKTPPTLGSTNVFGSKDATCVISVPIGSLAAYTSATNYPDSTKFTYIEED